MIEKFAQYSKVFVINAMTEINHPCEVLAYMYLLSKIRDNFIENKYLFCSVNGNICLAWKEASEVMGFELSQYCGAGYEMDDIKVYHDIKTAIQNKDIICTDSLSAKELNKFRDCQVTKEVMNMANKNVILNPCPPFYRSEEVFDDVIQSKYFVGYEFKKEYISDSTGYYALPFDKLVIYNLLDK